jgi:hypothetical protein
MSQVPDFDDPKNLRLKADVVSKTVAALQSMKGDSLLSGDDSGLRNIWEEVCVQVQGEESYYWESYLEVIEDLLSGYVDQLSGEDRLALWLSTEDGSDWLGDVKTGDADPNTPEVATDQISDYLKSELLSRAEDFQNSATRRYLAGGDEDEDEEGSEQELFEGSLSAIVSNPQSTDLTPADIKSIWEQAVAEVQAEEQAAPGTARNLDVVFAALDEGGKASLVAALAGLREIFGSKKGLIDASDSLTSQPQSAKQVNIAGT